MSSSTVARRVGVLAGVTVLGIGSSALPANAADLTFPACPGFDVGLTFLTGHGNPAQAGPRAVVAAGSGTSILDNEVTGASITFRGAGSFNIDESPDGTLFFTATGRSVVFLFDTDPGGPSTILYTGGVSTMQSPDGTFTVVTHSGSAVDLCAVLGAS